MNRWNDWVNWGSPSRLGRFELHWNDISKHRRKNSNSTTRAQSLKRAQSSTWAIYPIRKCSNVTGNSWRGFYFGCLSARRTTGPLRLAVDETLTAGGWNALAFDPPRRGSTGAVRLPHRGGSVTLTVESRRTNKPPWHWRWDTLSFHPVCGILWWKVARVIQNNIHCFGCWSSGSVHCSAITH